MIPIPLFSKLRLDPLRFRWFQYFFLFSFDGTDSSLILLEMSASASGADTKPNGSAHSRDHNQGNQDRKYTPEQKAAVLRVRKCSQTAYYEILALEKTATDAEIKKAYRKLSLMTHPDKNGYEGADEAFKSMYTLSTFERASAMEYSIIATIIYRIRR